MRIALVKLIGLIRNAWLIVGASILCFLCLEGVSRLILHLSDNLSAASVDDRKSADVYVDQHWVEEAWVPVLQWNWKQYCQLVRQ